MIRAASVEDLDSIVEVLSHFNFQVLTPIDKAPLDRLWGRDFAIRNEVTELDLGNGFVAEHEGKVVGFCHFREEDDATAKTTLLSVPPAFRKNGFGRALQEARMEKAYRAGYKRLVTYCEHPDSQRWYIKHFSYRAVSEEPVMHRIYYFKGAGGPVWGVHFGFKEYPVQKKLVCDLEAFFSGRGSQ